MAFIIMFQKRTCTAISASSIFATISASLSASTTISACQSRKGHHRQAPDLSADSSARRNRGRNPVLDMSERHSCRQPASRCASFDSLLWTTSRAWALRLYRCRSARVSRTGRLLPKGMFDDLLKPFCRIGHKPDILGALRRFNLPSYLHHNIAGPDSHPAPLFRYPGVVTQPGAESLSWLTDSRSTRSSSATALVSRLLTSMAAWRLYASRRSGRSGAEC
jgi:hypothetical protein